MGMNLRFVGPCPSAVSLCRRSIVHSLASRAGEGAMCVQDWRTCTHHPVAIFRNSDALASFLELKVLKQLHSIRIFSVILETSFPLSGKPLRKWPCCGRASDGIHRDCRMIA